MINTNPRRVIGLAGIAAAVAILIELPLYFVYSGPPPDSNVLTRSLFAMVSLTLLTVFMTGLRGLFTTSGGSNSPSLPSVPSVPSLAATVASTAGLMWVGVQFIANGLETGAVIQAPERIDPTIAVSGTYVLYGTTTRLIEALFLVTFGIAAAGAGALPRWTQRSAYVLAAINLAFVPSIFFGNDPSHFYAANGWGTTATLGGLFTLWLLATGIAVVRGATARPVEGHLRSAAPRRLSA